ncbi:protein singles bar-like [Ischnura elegans]|uniref:protein singles bar-like n=1 Tax=Ischnura elegans TaxID=197161 RepID=UPI001ED8952E|nr:protein singles bar-like [Ischnura elegans]
MGTRQPVVVRVVKHGGHSTGGQGGINCCCCRCFPCIHFNVLSSTEAKYKIAEAFLAGGIQSLLLKYGHNQTSTIGFSYDSCLTTACACLLTSIVMLISYIISPHSIGTLRATPFEWIFNGLACILYLSSGGYLAFTVSIFLFPLYMTLPFFQAYPALSACYVMCFFAAIIHGIDAYKAYKK